MIAKRIKNIDSTLQEKLGISNALYTEIKRFIIAFFCAWLLSILINDFLFVWFKKPSSFFIIGFSNFIISATEFILNLIGFETYSYQKYLQILGTPGVRIEMGCLGLRHITLFTLFIACYFGEWKHKLWYIIMGISTLLISNVIRIVIICISQTKIPESTGIIHDVASPIFMYPTILLLWLIWISSLSKKRINKL